MVKIAVVTTFIVLILLIFIYLHKKFFSVIICKEGEGTHVLSGQFRTGKHIAFLPNPKGTHNYEITVNSGTLRLNHSAYNPDGGTWTLNPVQAKQVHFDLIKQETFAFSITIGESYGNNDRLELVNTNSRKAVTFTYRMT